MPTGPPRAGHDGGILVRLTGRGGRSRTGPPRSGGRYGLLLAVLIGTYLLSAFNGKNLATELQIGLFAVVLLLALRTSPLPGRWPLAIGTATVAGSAAALGAALTDTSGGIGAACYSALRHLGEPVFSPPTSPPTLRRSSTSASS